MTCDLGIGALGLAWLACCLSSCSSSDAASNAGSSRICFSQGTTQQEGCYCLDGLDPSDAPGPLVDHCTATWVGLRAICCQRGKSCVCAQVGCFTTGDLACTCAFNLGSEDVCPLAGTRCCTDIDGCVCDSLGTVCSTSTAVRECTAAGVQPVCDIDARLVATCS